MKKAGSGNKNNIPQGVVPVSKKRPPKKKPQQQTKASTLNNEFEDMK